MRTPKVATASIVDSILDNTATCAAPPAYNPPSRAYAVNDPESLNDFAKVAHEKLGAMIAHGKTRAAAVFEKVMNEVPTDYIRPASFLGFELSNLGANTELLLRTAESARDDAKVLDFKLHRHALGQIATLGEIPMTFVNTLLDKGTWGKTELARILTTLYGHLDSRHLLRVVKGEVRGVLSDKFRRLDTRPLIEAFVKACQATGAMPFDGHALDTKVQIKAVIPHIYQAYANELMVLGVTWSNSDYGNGAHSLDFYMERLVCKNGMIRAGNSRQVHIGKRLSDDIAFSQRTVDLDTQATASAIGDIVKTHFTPDAIERQLGIIRAAHEKGINLKGTLEALKKTLTKAEVELVAEKFTSDDVVNLPAGNNLWRLSNALSWVANVSTDEERKIELQRVAGNYLPDIAA